MYNKVGNIKLETTAQYQKPIETNIKYYNTDTGTAQLVFNVTRNQFPLEISDKNTHSFIILRSSDEHYIVDDVEFLNPLKGVIAYTIPSEFLSKPGKVQGQIYINVKGTSDVITQVDFNFMIEDAVINTIPTVEKVKIIRTFVELQESVKATIEEIRERLTDGEKTVNEIKAVLDDGVNRINTAKDNAQKQLDSSKEKGLKELTAQTNDHIDEINNIVNEAMDNIQDLNPTNTNEWQKSKLTKDDGRLTQSNYECVVPTNYKSVNAPNVGTTLAYVANIYVYEGYSGRKEIRLIKVNDNTEYHATLDNGGTFKGWKKVLSYADNMEVFNDTGWIDFQLENGTKDRSLTTGEGYLYKNQYRVIKMFGVTYGHIRFNITNITNRAVIGRIPSKMVPKAQTGLLRTGLSQNPITFTIDTDGNILIYLNTNDISAWSNQGYAIGEHNWIIDNDYFDVQAPTYIEGESPEDLNIKVENTTTDNNESLTDGEELNSNDELTDSSLSDILPDYGDVLKQPDGEEH
ncbi:BppU family phage baseplate upper protein (plasmid) [Staphylococcus aureus]|uniref:BppU family phage baseplate upper protein n=1 Tax=Staphylococcus aureus TaxID=1280 RepID=UPI0021D20989|nr:BppU family phage baseplate upper protein [Staphylococcus aureus]UXV54426.1 BppU family phage baseplate upper protein [Staphylococcus aureus]UXV57099.1 BppU family phage baseplate upper protein [Staphylococcus aureus]